ncbi:hypothetical protein, partial [Nitrosomonas sp.]|uniref:hypothetical protein n=1 Tax=Nitrosomonas sp. TaxID=42353 RepID=UPI0025D1822C
LNVTLSGAASISSGANNSSTLTLSGTQAEINATLASLIYQGDSGYTGSDTLTVTSTDSAVASDIDTVSITVTAGNVAPVNAVPGAQNAVEDTPFVLGGISVSDANGDLATVQLAVAHGTLNVTLSGAASITSGANNSSTLTLSGTQAEINATLASLSYQGMANFNGADSLTITSTDSNSGMDVDTVAITVTAVNDVPVNTVPGAKTAAINGSLALNGISVNDVDGNLASIQLQVTNGMLTVTLFGTASISGGINGSNTLTLSGSQADINSTLSSLYYQANTGFSGLEKLTISSIDSNGASDIDFIDISIPLPVPVPVPLPEPESSPILVPPLLPEPMLPIIISVIPNLPPTILPISVSGLVDNTQLSTSSPQMAPSFVSTYFIDGKASDTETSLGEPANHLGINRSTSQSREVDSALTNKATRFVTENYLSLQVITETALSSLPSSEIDYTQKDKNFWIEVTQLDDEFQENLREEELTLQIVAATGLSMTALAAAWLTRTGAFFVGLFSVFPTVKSIDPLAILDHSTNSHKQEAEVEEAILKNKLALYEEIFNKSDPKQ